MTDYDTARDAVVQAVAAYADALAAADPDVTLDDLADELVEIAAHVEFRDGCPVCCQAAMPAVVTATPRVTTAWYACCGRRWRCTWPGTGTAAGDADAGDPVLV
ncbi:hypothetical protein [Rhodococcus aetherivorans]|uniref:hypothetical protein n=1 Tax=Rhodococcus aetherivorans TaxID=191292 RepID=UPI002949535F|nr:hypothetical protein [Rhodococcus aetherivorans]MDV6291652.1 hypothetical protein [Rhodococcus aetherivorans]